MSIILKGIDMPEANEIRMIAIKSNGEIFFNTVKDGVPDKTEMSQAIQIPKGHGRLIDADKLRRGFSRTESGYCGYWEFCDKPEDMQFLIDDEPTILEAEE